MSVSNRSASGASSRPAPRRVYVPAVGPRLRPLLWIVLIGFALLGATGIYMGSVTLLTELRGAPQDTYFYMLMVVLHVAIGLVLILPFIAFGFGHLLTSWKRPNRAAVRYGLILLVTSIVLLVSGLILVRLEGFEVRDPTIRNTGYWLHVLTPLLAIGLYIRHRLAGPRINWKYARIWGATVAAIVVVMGALHSVDPRVVGKVGPRDGAKYFFPSEVKTADGNLIPEQALMSNDMCLRCHEDAYNGWFHSAHHFSSFNNPMYLFSVRETREVSLERDGTTQASRWCAGCHDPVPFLSGRFDDPNYDDVNDPTAHAGITCVSCHSITHVNSTRGNADYTIEEPPMYPGAYSENPIARFIHDSLIKAKPAFHKQSFLKPLHKTPEFCSTCHKVSLPFELNHYKDFLRGQNHFDSYWLSGVSGNGARSFYYPQVAEQDCNGCHMPLMASDDFGARNFDGAPGREIHNHLFPGGNTGLPAALGYDEAAKAQADYLRDGKLRIDLFALREDGSIEGDLIAPLRPESPELEPGRSYLVEAVVRTLAVGHHFTQGTTDSNQVWVELIARDAQGRVIGRSGGIDEEGYVDSYSHFINTYMLDRFGNRIDRRNAQDIFVPLYSNQIPPGAGQVIHYRLNVPEDAAGPIEIEAKVHYRKFDRTFLDYIYGEGEGPELPIVTMAEDRITLPVRGGPSAANPPSPIEPAWQRWNDYGIGLFLEGSDTGAQKGELRQAEVAFKRVARQFDQADGWVNLARVYQREGRIPDALDALENAASHPDPAAPWTINWLTGQINMRLGNVEGAIRNFEAVLATRIDARGFRFANDYVVNNELGLAYDRRGRVFPPGAPERLKWMAEAIRTYRKTLAIDSENEAAHFGLGQAYSEFVETRPELPPWDGPPPAPEELLEAVAAWETVDWTEADQSLNLKIDTPFDLAQGIDAFVTGPRPQDASRVGTVIEVVERLGPVWDAAEGRPERSDIARFLETAHKALHNFIRPDETAQGRAMRIARRNDPAANQNAQSIVIHDLRRPGAPGLDLPAEPRQENAE